LVAMANTDDKEKIIKLSNTYKTLMMIESNIEADINDKLIAERGEENNG